MVHRSVLSLLALFAFLLAGCAGGSGPHKSLGISSNPQPSSLSGNWTATTSSINMSPPQMSFTFTMTEGMSAIGATGLNQAPITVSNVVFATSNNCFDNAAAGSGMVNGTAGSQRTLSLTLNENGNTITFSMNVPAGNSSATGSFSLAGGHTIGVSTSPCVAGASGNAAFNLM